MRMAGLLKSLIFVLCISSLQAFDSLQLPALGRPFNLGDLYNAKDGNLILGPTLWRSDRLSNYSQTIQRKTNFEIVASEDNSELRNHFDINAHLALEFLGGLIKVSGSAGYLDDRIRTSNTARVSLKFDARTFHRKLKPDMFIGLDYPDVLDKVKDATHVVVSIEYGASAVFVFDRTVSSSEIKKDVKGSMQIAIKSIPGISVVGGGDVKLSEEEKKKVDKFSCKFYGDFVLKEHPGSYIEAIKVYKALPDLLGVHYENSVPMRVFLFPLDALPIARTNEILHEIKNSLVNEVTVQIQLLDDIVVLSNDILDSVVSQYHERIRKNAEAFKSYIEIYTVRFKQHLGKLLPVIRGNGAEESKLAKMLADKEISTFSTISLKSWIEEAKEEVHVLEKTHSLPNYCRNKGEFAAKLLNNEKYTFALTMRLDEAEDGFVKEMHDYLETKEGLEPMVDFVPYLGKKEKWWTDYKLVNELTTKASSFVNFYRLEEERKKQNFKSDIQFIVREAELGGKKPGTTIELYEKALLVDPDFEIPSSPGVPQMNASSYDSIAITWQEPEQGSHNVIYYEVQTFLLREQKNITDQEEKLKIVATLQSEEKQEYLEIPRLMPERYYMFIVSVYSKLGKTSVGMQSNYMETTSCPEGMYLSDEQCVSCDPGYYSKEAGSLLCQKCPIGTYSDTFGCSECQPCPNNTTTLIKGARDESECGEGLKGKVVNIVERALGDVQTQIDKIESDMNKTFEEVQTKIHRIESKTPHIHLTLIQSRDVRVESAFRDREWSDYRNGFGQPQTSEFWLGLDKIHEITRSGRWNVVFEVIWHQLGAVRSSLSPDPRAGSSGRLEMADFKVASSADNYRLAIGGMVSKENWGGSAADVRRLYTNSMNGKAFGTPNRPNGGRFESGYYGGWWGGTWLYLGLNSNYRIILDGPYRWPATTSMWLKKVG